MDRKLTSSELKKLNSKKALRAILSREPINIERTLRYVDYERKLIKLQTEVIKLQTWAIKNNERFKSFFNLFISLNIIKELGTQVENWTYTKLDETNKIADQIREKIKLHGFS